MKKVYLAGGFKTRWQDVVIKNAPQFKFLDPSLHGIEDPDEYTEWDLKAVEQSDIVFAHMEGSNPGGYAMALEIGYAKALNKTVIYTESGIGENLKKRFDMVRSASDFQYTNINDGIKKLNELQ